MMNFKEFNEDERQLTEYSIIKIQSVVRLFVCRSKLLKLINIRYEKIFDPNRKKYYYYDKVNDSSSWSKPRLLLDKDLDKIAQTYTDDEAAIIIQKRVRMMLSLLRVRLLYQINVITSVDETSGYNYYYNPKSEMTMWELPYFMNGRMNYEKKKAVIKVTKSGRRSSVARRASKAVHDSVEKKGEESQDTSGGSDEEDDNADGDDNGDGALMGGELDPHPEGDEGSEVTGLSEDSEMVRERRRQHRRFPRSKVQGLVDAGEDNIASTTELDLSGIGATRFTSRLYDLDELKTLVLARNRLARVSPDMQYLTNLTNLDLSHNKLESLPKEMEELKLLRTVNLSHNSITNYPGQFYKLKKLTHLDLSHNQLKQIPVETGNLELLKDLGQWDVGVGLLVRMQHLDVSYNLLTEWPAQIELLVVLKILDLSYNEIAAMSPVISALQALEHLDVSHNRLENLPHELYDLPNLKYMALHENRLLDWPPSENVNIYQSETHRRVIMFKLAELNASHNALAVMDRRLDMLRYLLRLDVSHNKLSSFVGSTSTDNESFESVAVVNDDALCMLTMLTSLDMSHNLFAEMTASLGALVNLTAIDLSHNQLTEVPISFMKLTRLVKINLSHNRLAEASGKIFAMLNDLQHLELQHNELAVLPPLLYTLKKVSFLDLSHNHVTVLLDSVQQLVALTHLNLSHNSIAELPETISALTQLTILELKSNRITALPDSLSCLKQLRRVTLSRNDLSRSPQLLKILPQLVTSNLSWNLRLPVHSIDWAQRTQEYDSLQNPEFVSVQVLQRTLLACQAELDALTSAEPLHRPLYQHEVAPAQKSKNDEYKELLGGADESDDEDAPASGVSTAVKGTRRNSQLKENGKSAAVAVKKPKKKKTKKLTPAQRTMAWHANLEAHFRQHYLPAQHDNTAVVHAGEQFRSGGDGVLMRAIHNEQQRQASLHISVLLQSIDAQRGYPSGSIEFVQQSSSDSAETHFNAALVEACLEEEAQLQSLLERYQRLLQEVNAMALVQRARDILEHPEPETEVETEVDFASSRVSIGGSSTVNAKHNSFHDGKQSENRANQRLLAMAFGDQVEQRLAANVSKTAILQNTPVDQLPSLLHFARPLHNSTKFESSERREDQMTELVFWSYVGLAKVLLAKGERIAHSIRRVEIRGAVKVSCLDWAQRKGGDDLFDLMADVYSDLSDRIGAKEAARSTESLSTRKKNKVSALMDSLLSPASSGASDENPATEETGGAEDDDKVSDNMSKVSPASGAPPVKPLSEILPVVNPEDLLPIEPITPSETKSCLRYLTAHRTLTLQWALQSLDIAAHILKMNGWDLSAPSFKLHNKHQFCGQPDWLREGALAVARCTSEVCRGLQLYSRALEECGKLLRLAKRVDCKQVLLTMVRIHTAQGNFLLAKKLLLEVIEEYLLKPLQKTALPEVFELLRLDKEMALLLQYLETSVVLLTDSHGVFSPEQVRVFCVQDNGLLSMSSTEKFPEITHGRQLRDVKKGSALKARRAEEKSSVELYASRVEFRAMLSAEKERVRAALAAVVEC